MHDKYSALLILMCKPYYMKTSSVKFSHQLKTISKPSINFAPNKISIFAVLSITIMLSFVVVIGTAPSSYAQDQQTQQNQTSPMDCASTATNVSQNAAPLQNPNKDVCDFVVLRQAPDIIGYNGTILNKFLAINSLFEIMSAAPNMSNIGNGSGPMVVAIGEFGLLQTELKPMLMALSNVNWNVTAIHNHSILEKPPMIFVHWDAMGNLDTFVSDAKALVTQFEQLQQISGSGSGDGQSGNSTGQNPLGQIGETIGDTLGLNN